MQRLKKICGGTTMTSMKNLLVRENNNMATIRDLIKQFTKEVRILVAKVLDMQYLDIANTSKKVSKGIFGLLSIFVP